MSERERGRKRYKIPNKRNKSKKNTKQEKPSQTIWISDFLPNFFYEKVRNSRAPTLSIRGQLFFGKNSQKNIRGQLFFGKNSQKNIPAFLFFQFLTRDTLASIDTILKPLLFWLGKFGRNGVSYPYLPTLRSDVKDLGFQQQMGPKNKKTTSLHENSVKEKPRNDPSVRWLLFLWNQTTISTSHQHFSTFVRNSHFARHSNIRVEEFNLWSSQTDYLWYIVSKIQQL